MIKIFNKKSQSGEALTWLVATIIIIFILLIGIFIAGTKADVAGFIGFDKEVSFAKNYNRAYEKSFHSYLLTDEDGKKVYDIIKESEELDRTTGNFAKEVFEEDSQVWMGVIDEYRGKAVENNYFGKKTIYFAGGEQNYFIFTREVRLNSEEFIELIIKDE